MTAVTGVHRHLPLVRYAVLGLSVPTLLLVAVHVGVGAYHRYVRAVPAVVDVVDLGQDGSLPSVWNVALLLADAAVALIVAALTAPGRTPSSRSWLVVAAAFTYLALDEGVGLHERLKDPGQGLADVLGIELSTYAWVLPGAVLALAGLAVFALWCRALPVDVRRWFVAAVLVYFTGALVVEALNGYFRSRGADLLHLAGTTVEESLEMAGCVLAAAAMLRLVQVSATTRTTVLRPLGPLSR